MYRHEISSSCPYLPQKEMNQFLVDWRETFFFISFRLRTVSHAGGSNTHKTFHYRTEIKTDKKKREGKEPLSIGIWTQTRFYLVSVLITISSVMCWLGHVQIRSVVLSSLFNWANIISRCPLPKQQTPHAQPNPDRIFSRPIKDAEHLTWTYLGCCYLSWNSSLPLNRPSWVWNRHSVRRRSNSQGHWIIS